MFDEIDLRPLIDDMMLTRLTIAADMSEDLETGPNGDFVAGCLK